MSTYCIRNVEYINDEGKWTSCGEWEDNYHGFDRWRNENYYDRGIPKDSPMADHNFKDEETGVDYYWGKSYITLAELATWMDKEKDDAYAYIFSELHRGRMNIMEKRLANIEKKLGILDSKEQGEKQHDNDDGDELTALDSLNVFSELIEESMEQYDGLSTQYIRAMSLVENTNGGHWISPDKVRIVFYFG